MRKAAQNTVTIPAEVIGHKIYLVRNQKVMLDRDLAAIYKVETRALIQAVSRNAKRFPSGFKFQLNAAEFQNWRSQFVISNSPLAIGLRRPPYAFTELGVVMLSSVLNSNHAIKMNILIMRTFVRLREVFANQQDLAHAIGEIGHRLDVQDGQIASIFQTLDNLTGPERLSQHPLGFLPNPKSRR